MTESFIEKVSKAKEIQALCKHRKGDWFWNGEKPVVYCKAGLGSFSAREHKWLPTLEDLFEKAINSPSYPLKIDGVLYRQNENFGISIYKQFEHYEIVLKNSPSEYAYNWIHWKEPTFIECVLDVYMFRLFYEYWDNNKWIKGLWDRDKRQFNQIKEWEEIK